MENNNEKQEFEFSLVSFFKIFRGKFKMLVAIGVISAILGATVGALISTIGNKAYGSTLTFHLPTSEKNEYSAIIPLLESDLFAEDILIGTKTVEVIDKSGETVEIEIPDLSYTSEDEETLVKYEAEKLRASKAIFKCKERLKELPLEINNLKSQLDTANNIYSPYRDEYNRLLNVSSDTFADKQAVEKLQALESSEAYITAKNNFNSAQNAYDNKITEQTKYEALLFVEEEALKDASDNAESIIKEQREKWAQKEENKKSVSRFKESVTYSFTKDKQLAEDAKAEDITKQFIYVNVNVKKDRKQAENIVSNISKYLPEFIIENTEPLEKYDQIKCVRISSNEIRDLNDDSPFGDIAKFAIIFIVAFEALACIVIIGSYLKKNWLPTVMADESIENTENSEENKD